MSKVTNPNADTVRLDQWLWAARFFKQRPLAVKAIKNQRVRVNGQRVKPARSIQIGDEIQIEKQKDLIYTVIVQQLHSKRVSASIASTFYRETDESIAAREKLRAQQQLAKDLVNFPKQKPDKRERRKIRSMRHHEF